MEVYTRPAKRFVADFMGLVNVFPGEATAAGAFSCAGFSLANVRLPPGFAGGAVDLVVRPENARLAAAGQPGLFEAKIVERVFLGNLCEYQLRLASGTTMRVQTHPLRLFEPDAPVSVSIDAGECSVFPARDA